MQLFVAALAACLSACCSIPAHRCISWAMCREFEIWRYTPPAGTEEALPAAAGPLLLLVQQGEMHVRCGAKSRRLRRGDVYFVGAGAALELSASADVTAWVAGCNGMAFA